MQATLNQTSKAAKATDQYLGYEITSNEGLFIATPMGWRGETLLADSLPIMRKKIWRWWHMTQVQ